MWNNKNQDKQNQGIGIQPFWSVHSFVMDKKKQSYEYFRRVSPSTRSFGDCNHGHNIVIGSKLSLCLRKLYSRHKANLDLEPISIQYNIYTYSYKYIFSTLYWLFSYILILSQILWIFSIPLVLRRIDIRNPVSYKLQRSDVSMCI